MTEKERERLVELLQEEGSEVHAKEAKVSEVTLLKAILGIKGVHHGSTLAVDGYAKRAKPLL